MNKEEKLAKAIAFAAEKHANQKRKDGTPYIFHPLTVAELLKRYGYDIDYQVAGILHDVLEDTDATDEEVRAFGDDVYEAVKLVTRPKGADEAEYVKNILTNHMAAAVKNADKVHNMCDIITTNNRNAILNYAKKVEKYYKGKFSYALDNTIDNALYMSDFCNIDKEVRCCIPDYTMEEMKLYSDRKKETREKAYSLFPRTGFMTLSKKKKFFVRQNPNEILLFLLFGQTKEKRKKIVSKNTCKFPLFLSLHPFLHTKSMNDLLDKSQKNKERGFTL